MLKFLTHKLRTHSLNEENVSEKVEERDSGTESDDEADRADTGDFCTDVIMKWNDVTDISMGGVDAGSPCACAAPHTPPPHAHNDTDTDTDLLYDHHSSEEELEVINGAPSVASAGSGGSGAGGVAGPGAGTAGVGAGAAGGAGPAAPPESRRRGASSPPAAHPEKRKWTAHAHTHPYLDSDVDADELAARPPSDDDDDTDTKVETPVRFRTSPPLEALKPRRAGGAACACSGSGGTVVPGERAPPSPRRRRQPLPPPRRHRPALDFDKMQQLKVGGGGVRSWRAVGGAHGGELSVFCW